MSRLLGVALVFCSAAAAAGPSGRVVRVERSSRSMAVPRVCEIHGQAGNCIGDAPRSGQIVSVLDEHRVVADVQIVEVTRFSPNCPTVWTVKTRGIRGASADSVGIGVIDPGLDPSRARVIDRSHLPPSPSGSPDEDVWRAIDRDGDGDPDILITRLGCDSSGRPVSGGAAYCVDVWVRIGARMTRTAQVDLTQCNR